VERDLGGAGSATGASIQARPGPIEGLARPAWRPGPVRRKLALRPDDPPIRELLPFAAAD